MNVRYRIVIMLLVALLGCKDSEEATPNISILSSMVNGSRLADGLEDVSPDAEIAIVFSAPVDPANLTDQLTLNQVSGEMADYTIAYENAQSKVVLTASLTYNTSYTLRISTGPLGKQGERLDNSLEVSFTTVSDGTVRSMPPCTGSGDCLTAVEFSVNGETASIPVYNSYPVNLEEASWEKLKYAVIVVHGQNRNADDYFTYLTSALSMSGLQDSTLLLAPLFNAESLSPGELSWSSTSGWREGQESNSDVKISSFAVIDSLIARLNDKSKFPVLKKVIVTGHSSGGLFSHLFAAANISEKAYPDTEFQYIVANSQYFYYPTGLRYNESTESFYEPTGCTGYDFWPLGFTNIPVYADGITENTFNDQFVTRHITYLLGNDSGSDGSLNTTDCGATLLGSTRYLRGEHIYRYMNTYFAEVHEHDRVIVSGVGHDGEKMYKSSEFIALLESTLH